MTEDRYDLMPRRCKKEDFGIATSYFHGLSFLEDLYCMDNYDIANVQILFILIFNIIL